MRLPTLLVDVRSHSETSQSQTRPGYDTVFVLTEAPTPCGPTSACVQRPQGSSYCYNLKIVLRK